MKFKVGDKVRVTREALAQQADSSFVKSYEVSWWKIKKIAGDAIYCPNKEYWYEEKHLELVPEEPEFKRGEIVEVFSIPSDTWFKRIFVCEIPWAAYPYVCVDGVSSTMFREWKEFNITTRDKIRKIEQKLTRKEIAERFWVNEDFELIED